MSPRREGRRGAQAGHPVGRTEFDIGVHGAVKKHYRIDAKDLPLPVDYIVAATAG